MILRFFFFKCKTINFISEFTMKLDYHSLNLTRLNIIEVTLNTDFIIHGKDVSIKTRTFIIQF